MKNKKLRKLLIDKDLKFKQLAEMTDVSFRQVSRIINGTSEGSLKWWRKAAEVLEVDITEIME